MLLLYLISLRTVFTVSVIIPRDGMQVMALLPVLISMPELMILIHFIKKVMKIKIFVIPFLFILIITTSSFKDSIFYQKHTHIIFEDTVTNKVNTKGYYFYAERGPIKYFIHDAMNNQVIDTADTYCDFIFFYEDGTIFIFHNILKHFHNIQSAINEKYFDLHDKKFLRNVGMWGSYSIFGSNIKATVYLHDPSRFRPWVKEEMQFNIKNSETILLQQTSCDRCKNQYEGYGDSSKIIFNPPKPFSFIPISIKPDSSVVSDLTKKHWHIK